MPAPSAPKTNSVTPIGWVTAYPSAAPINGAVQGAATTTANTPVPKPSASCRPPPTSPAIV